jgi:hypothetical protein
MKPTLYARHRFPAVVIVHAVWLYFRFTMSFRGVEDLLVERANIAGVWLRLPPAQMLPSVQHSDF